jgi:hypothetical protein
MALGITPLPNPTQGGRLRGEKLRVVVFSPDASIPAGGYTVLASAIGFTYLDFGMCGAVNDGSAYYADFKIGTASTDGTLKFFNVSCSSTNKATDIGTAVGASLASLTTNPVTMLVIGR